MLTEDIDVSWALQRDHWDVRYEPNAMCGILMPETLRGLWRQRLRWAQGGVEVIRRHAVSLLRWRHRRQWLILVEYLLSVLWAYCMATLLVLWAVGLVLPLPDELRVGSPIPGWHGVILGITCLVQILVSMLLERRFERGLARTYYWMVWYPLAFWLLSMCTSVVAVPKALAKKRGRRATWVSPDRGVADA